MRCIFSHLLLNVVPGNRQAIGAVIVLSNTGVQFRHQRLAQLYFEDEAEYHHYQLQQKRERHAAEILHNKMESVRTASGVGRGEREREREKRERERINSDVPAMNYCEPDAAHT